MKILYKLLFYFFEKSRIRHCKKELNLVEKKRKYKGYSIYYLEKKGIPNLPVLIFIHGFLDSSYGFRKLIKHLNYPGRILIPDIPGYGRSKLPRMSWIYSLDIFSQILKTWIEDMNLNNFILGGHSMGGLIVQKIAIQYANAFPDSKESPLSGCILMASGGIPHPERDRMRNVLFPKSIFDISILLGYLYHTRFPEPSYFIKKTLLSEWNGWKNQTLAENTIKKEKEIFHGDKAKLIKSPTLIMVGEEDELTTPEMMMKTHKWIKNSKLVVFQETRHALHNERAEWVAQSIREFLDESKLLNRRRHR